MEEIPYELHRAIHDIGERVMTRICKHEGCDNELIEGRWGRECTPCINNKRLYGITTGKRNEMYTAQDGKCAICSS